MSFWCGFLAAILFMCIAHEVAKSHRWDRWTIDDFKLSQESELKEFLLHKSEQAKSEKVVEDLAEESKKESK